MKWLSFKKITLLFFTVALVSNVFATNVQTSDTNSERCELENLHTNPCIIVSVGDVAIEIEQETDVISSAIEMPVIDFEFSSLIQETIFPKRTDFSDYYAKDLSPPSIVQLPRSHINNT
ncbi:hypothetical protein CL684_00140 [Candidatus Campbellbacteria bacterium]|nr:hypothetical protein [Candidatus Campbellbacteria bacterium]